MGRDITYTTRSKLLKLELYDYNSIRKWQVNLGLEAKVSLLVPSRPKEPMLLLLLKDHPTRWIQILWFPRQSAYHLYYGKGDYQIPTLRFGIIILLLLISFWTISFLLLSRVLLKAWDINWCQWKALVGLWFLRNMGQVSDVCQSHNEKTSI